MTSWWTVKNDSCILYTSYLRVEVDSSVLTCDFRLNQSGNLDIEDNAYIQYQVNDGGWVTDTAISGYGLASVWFRSFPLTLYYGDCIQFRVIYETNNNTEFWALQNDDISISGNFEVYSEPPDPMPVEFLFISSEKKNSSIQIVWITATETNNDYFSIERSENGIDFQSIGITSGAGNSNAVIEYAFSDDSPFTGYNYYRIKQTDFDGKFSFSEITFVNFENFSDNISVASGNGNIVINIFSEEESNVNLSIFELSGKQVASKKYMVSKGQNQINAGNEILSDNIYIINIENSGGESYSAKHFME